MSSDVNIKSVDITQVDFDLPPQYTVLRRLIRVLGVPDALVLLRARGGIPLKLPMSAAGILLEMFGAEKVEALLAEFGPGMILTLPMSDKLDAKIRNIAIKAEHMAGVSLADLALRYRLTVRQVINIIQAVSAEAASAATGANDPQADLFGRTGSKP